MSEQATGASATGASASGQPQAQTGTAGSTAPGQGPANPYGPYPYPPYAPYGYGYGYPPYQYLYYAHPPQPANSGWAIASLACGIAGLVGAGLIGSVLAIIFGHISMNEIKRSGDVMGGRGMAIAGLVLGYISTALTLIILIVYIGFLALVFTSIPAAGSGGFIH